MKTCHSAGYFKQLILFLLLSLMTVFVLSGNALAAITCADCHGDRSTSDLRPKDSTYRNITTGAFVGNHQTHMASTATAGTCATCHVSNGFTVSHRNGQISFQSNINTSPGTGVYNKASGVGFVNQTSNPVMTSATCSSVNCHFESITPTWGQPSSVLSCDSCHVTGSTGNKSATHLKHEAKYGTAGSNYVDSCTRCHPNRATFSHATSAGDRVISVIPGVNYSGGNNKYLPSQTGRTFGNCTNIYCHSSGQSLTGTATPVYPSTPPNWGTASTGACGTCHATTTLSSGSHTKHFTGISPNTNCGNCHVGATTTAYDSTLHVDTFINVTGAYTQGKSHAPGNGYGSCQAASCHDNGKGVKVATVNWGTSAGQCNACHAAAMTSDSHNKHLSTTLYKKAPNCAECHTGYDVSTNTAAANHVNGTIEVTTGGYPSPKGKGTAFGTCATSYCHSSGQSLTGTATPVYASTPPTWGGTAACGSCHATTTLSSGSHTKHFTGISPNTNCGNCHVGATATAYNSTLHVDKFINVTGAYTQGKSHAPGNGYGSCQAASCHDNGKGVKVATVNWGTSAGQCNACHAAAMTSDSHNKHLSTTLYKKAPNCAECHTGYDVSTNTAAANHLNSNIEVNTGGYPSPKAIGSAFGTCATSYCHSSGQSLTGTATPVYASTPPTWGGTAACGSCHATTTLSSGSHTKHFTGISPNTNCGSCHVGATATAYNSTLHVDKFINVTGAYTQGKSHAPGNGYGSCQAATCHDNGKGVKVATVNWGTSAGQCNACHAAAMTSDSHNKHLSTTLYKKAGCASCHTGYDVSTNTAAANHLNSNIEVNTGGYPSPKAIGSAFGTCATSYCHSSGQSLTGTATPVYASIPPTWGGTAACGSCHATTTLSSGSHTKHFTGISPNTNCGNCHVGATTTAYDSTLHVDTFINVTGAYTQGKSHAPGNGYGSCQAATCHDNGKGVRVATINWGTSAPQCGACHAAAMTSDSHNKHLNGLAGKYIANAVCADCHAGNNITTPTAAATHLNTTIEVTVGGYPSPKGKGTAFGACSNAYCHSNGKGTSQSVTWGQTSLNCKSCHPTLGGAHNRHIGGFDGTNAADWANLPFYQYTSTKSNGADSATIANYAFGCANCHPISASSHMNGTIEVTLNTGAGVSNLRSKNSSPSVLGTVGTNAVQCQNVYCHSDGKGGQTTTLAWSANYSAVDRCAQCHLNSPSGIGAHSAHVVGIHADDIFNGTSGKLSAGSTGSVSHGLAAQATTLNCNICHNATVTYARNRMSSACSTALCHPTATDTTATQNARIGNLGKHVNGYVEVQFANIPFVSKAQLRPGSFVNYTGGVAGWKRNQVAGVDQYKTGASAFDTSKNLLYGTAVYTPGAGAGLGSCANVVCHNMKSGQTVQWNSTLSCESCHSSL